ncbi:MAG: hypothetical protein CMN87_02605 [Stappia sp.]|uniref:DUF599 domain-containing protein n=1 Tax=Stappia sp. TaxID=1870903 RepID=UPI000C3EB376|nr:DUF599 family protein [Stappia sp.]MBM18881.1 hypothetical protein [Stappia sp.]
MNDLSILDLAAATVFLAAWLGFNFLVEHSPLKVRTLSYQMNLHRRRWMMETSLRRVRIMDVGIAAGLQQGTAFFASTSILAIGACFALLTSTDSILEILADIGLDGGTTPAEWEIKILGLALVYAYAFFKFGWAYRLFNYATILMGAMPDGDPPPEEGQAFAENAAGMMVLAGQHFTRGQRAFFFSIGYLGWFFGPGILIASTLFVLAVLGRRQFFSRAHALAVAGHKVPVPVREPLSDEARGRGGPLG